MTLLMQQIGHVGTWGKWYFIILNRFFDLTWINVKMAKTIDKWRKSKIVEMGAYLSWNAGVNPED